MGPAPERSVPAPVLPPVRSLLLLLLLVGCAAPQSQRSGDRVSGRVILAGSDQPLAGVRVVLLPVTPRDGADPEESPGQLSTLVTSNEAGAFAFDALEGLRESPLLRGWTYELRAEAEGFAVASQRLDFDGGATFAELQLDLILDDAFEGQQIQELSDDSIQNPTGTLIDEVLRQQGRLPRE